MEEKETIVHIISNADPQKCYNEVAKFAQGKDDKDVLFTWSTTVIPVNQHGQMIVVPSCLIFWNCSKEEAVSFRTQQKLMLKN